MRGKRRQQQLRAEEQQALEAVPGWDWGREAVMQQLSFDAKLELLQQFVQQHKRLPRGREEYQGVKLGQYCDNWRQRKRRLQPDQVEASATVDGWSQAEVGGLQQPL